MALKDIRDLRDDKEAYAAELEKRWTGLLSYRYIGKRVGSMDVGAEGDNTIKVRHDFRNSTGGLMVAPLAIASPEGGGRSDLEVVPNPVIHCAQILDPGHDLRRIEVRSENIKLGRQMGFSRSRIVDADNPERVIAYTEGQGVSIGDVPQGLTKMPRAPSRWSTRPTFRRCGRCSAPHAGLTGAGRCRSWRWSSRRPTRRCTSVRSTSYSRRRPWTPPPSSPAPTAYRCRRGT